MLGIQGIFGILVPYGIFRDSLYEELTFFMKKCNSITIAVLDLKFCMRTSFHPS